MRCPSPGPPSQFLKPAATENMALVPESRGRALYALSLLVLLGTVMVQVSKQAQKYRTGGTTLSKSKESRSELFLPDIRFFKRTELPQS